MAENQRSEVCKEATTMIAPTVSDIPLLSAAGVDGSLMRRTFLKRMMAFAGSAVVAKAYGTENKPMSNAHSGGSGRKASNAKSYYAYVGCRTTRERNARGEGINVYRMDASSGRWIHVQLRRGLVNPSFLAFDRSERFLYTVHGDSSEISAFQINDRTGELSFINRQSTHGKNPVHLSFDPTNRFVVVANHLTSSVAVLSVNQNDGSIGEVVDLVTLQGRIGPHRVEQPFAKPHQVEFDPSGKFIAVPDKGLDRVFSFLLDATGKLIALDPPSVAARETSGPRHIAFHPTRPNAYVINELDSTVTNYQYDTGGRLAPFQIVSSLPDTYTGNSRASEIAVSTDGRFVYGSNRGHDSLVLFSVDQNTGRLTQVEWVPSQGKTPRFFALDPTGAYLYAANEDSDTIVKFTVDARTGKLSPTDDIVKTGSPVCILFREAP
ncbi:MAG: lactonase family protein [Terriglobales bacterium]